MATRLAIREKQLETWTAIIQECRNSGMKTKDWFAEITYQRISIVNGGCGQNPGPKEGVPLCTLLNKNKKQSMYTYK